MLWVWLWGYDVSSAFHSDILICQLPYNLISQEYVFFSFVYFWYRMKIVSCLYKNERLPYWRNSKWLSHHATVFLDDHNVGTALLEVP